MPGSGWRSSGTASVVFYPICHDGFDEVTRPGTLVVDAFTRPRPVREWVDLILAHRPSHRVSSV